MTRAARLLLALAIVLTAVAPAAAATHAKRFDVGTAVEDITPTSPQFLGGYDRMDTPTAAAHDPLNVRAFVVRHAAHGVGFAIVDTQGWFAGYQEGPYGVTDARNDAAAALQAKGIAITADDLIVSSTHSHAAPTVMGIWGPTDPAYLKAVHDATVRALVSAATHTHRAELWTAEGSIEPLIAHNVEGTDHFDGWGIDPRTPILWARKPGSGATLGLYANVPVHADQYRGSRYRLASADHPGYVRKALEGSLGGTAVVAMGTLGRQEALGGISDNYDEVARQGDYIANAITRALTHAKPLTSARVAGATTYIAVPATNPALLALLYDNLAGFSCNDTLGACTIDRSVLPPYLAGDAVGTWVTALRIGDHAWVSEPGEAFPEVSTALRDAFPDAAGVHIVGMGQDQLGYYYPPEDYPASELNPSDFILFNVSGALADESVDAAALDARELGFAGTPGHPMMDDEDPQAFFHAGTQFFPSLDEAASPTREFLVEGKTSEAPVLPGSPDHSVSAIGVSFGDGTSAVAHGETRLTHTFPKPGTYTVTTRVTDEGGTERTYSHPIVVDPALDAGVDTTRRHGEDILRATLTGGDGHVIAAHWSFSDGTHADGLTVTRPRAHVGSRGTVTVVDGAGDTATASF